MPTCPHCATLLHGDARIGDVAQCTGCGQVFDAPPAATAPASAASTAPVVIGTPPRGVFVRRHPHGLELVLPWRRNLNAAGIVVHLLFVAMPLVGVLQTDRPAPWPIALLSLPIAYNLLYNLVNRTHVFIANGGVEVDHGPLPSFARPVRIGAREARRVLLESQERRTGKGGRWTVHHLEAPLAGAYLLKEWNHQETLAFVRDTIEAVFPPAAALSDDDLRQRAEAAALTPRRAAPTP